MRNTYVVTLNVWKPTSVLTIVEQGIMPDLGHASLEVVRDDEPIGYVSFWPEMDSAVGQVTNLFKHRLERHPVSLAQESDPTDGYMQRPPDRTEEMFGLDEERILRGWHRLKNIKYDFFHWNCSNVAKFLIVRAMTPPDQARLRAFLGCSDADLEEVNAEARHITGGPEDDEILTDRLRRLALTDFIRCIPDDLVVLAQALRESREVIPDPRVESEPEPAPA
ncbi:MAG: hypothetical protein SFU56_08425 [Capsulimonadales bacterium]|nr:hypothetical protein [Capsulimonadales bacterium]